jgi:hypothetical protein
MDAVAAANQDKFPLAVVLPMGKHEVVWKTFPNSQEPGSVCSIENIWSMVSPGTTALAHESLMMRLPFPAEPPASAGGTASTAKEPSLTVRPLTPNLAKFIACEANRWSEKIDMSPIYIQNPAKRSNLF